MGKGKKSIAVIDGQGGGIGSAMIKRLREDLAEQVEIIGLGTNAMATGAMLKGGANKGASGENAIVQTVKTVDIIIGTTGIVLANSMMGAPKEPLPHLIDQLVKRIKEIITT